MGYSYKTYSEMKDIMKKYVNATEGQSYIAWVKQDLWHLPKKQEQYIGSEILR